MENDEVFEADAEIENCDTRESQDHSYNGHSNRRSNSNHNDVRKDVIETSHESDSLLPHRQRPAAAWPGEHDYEGLTWWNRPSVCASLHFMWVTN